MSENEENSRRIVINKSEKEFKLNNKITIEDIDYFSKRVRINSPRSIKAMNSLGINNHDLEFLTFKQYLEKNPQLVGETKRIQKLEYNHVQAIRKDLINQVIESRKMIISENKNIKTRNASSKNRTSTSLENNNNQNFYLTRDLSDKDLKAIKRMKNINKTNLSNRLELELKKELKNLVNKEIDKKAKERQFMIFKNLEKKRKMENMKKMADEEEKEKLAKEIVKQQRKDEEKRIQDLIEEEIVENRLKKLNQKEEEELKKNNELKREEYKKKLNQLRDFEHKTVLEKSEQKQKKIRNNLVKLMKQRKRKRLNSEINFQNRMKVIGDNKKKLEEDLELNNQILLYKQRIQEKRKAEEEERKNKEIKLYEKRIIFQGKYNEIENTLKQKKLDNNQILEYLNSLEFINEKDKKQKEMIIKNEISLDKRKKNILNKINERERNLERTQHEKDYNNLIEKEKQIIKKLDKENKIKLMKQYLVNKRENLRDQQQERDEKVNKFMRNKTGIFHMKKSIYEEIMKENAQEGDKIEKILNRKSLDKKSLNSFKKIFPENDKIDEIINEINVLNKKKRNTRYKINSAY
jgi:hypothetical protein